MDGQSDQSERDPLNLANIASPALIIIFACPYRLHEFRKLLNATGDSFRLIYVGNLLIKRSSRTRQLTHRGEGMEKTGNISHDTTFVWAVRVTQIFDFEQLLAKRR